MVASVEKRKKGRTGSSHFSTKLEKWLIHMYVITLRKIKNKQRWNERRCQATHEENNPYISLTVEGQNGSTMLEMEGEHQNIEFLQHTEGVYRRKNF